MKNKGTVIILALLLGGFGIHRMYLNQTGKGMLYLLFFWTFIPGIIAFIEVFYFAFMSEEKFDETYNKKFLKMIR